ncbi:MAG TPA: amino acid adenylation domain-containing protein, partial [Longimicrobium sp.]|nr:amino acid adenylation domain-containing protein [Longimicrobium sp.]
FAVEPGGRLYRTGDRARWKERTHALPHSRTHALEYLGRADHQVKVRGYRIELGEIEAALAAHPAVREAAALVRESSGDPRLYAWAVLHDGETADAAALRGHLRAWLPEYMVPAAVTLLDALPLTPNGKVDRAALPAPEGGEAAGGYVAPRTPTEEVLAGVWAELLGAGPVGSADGFFALGGHSLLATRLVSRVRAVFGVELPLRAVFEHASLAELAREVDRARGAGSAALPPIVPVDRTLPLAPSFAQQRLWFLDRLEPGSPLYNVPLALRISGEPDVDALARALDEIARRHEPLRTTFREIDGAVVQVVDADGALPLSFGDLTALPAGAREAEAERLVREEAAAPFDLARGPLCRARLLRLSAGEHVLLLTLHHAVSDGWSLGVLLRELSALYGAFARGEASPLAPPPVQYADFAAWQREHLDGVMQAQLAWWKERLAGAPAVLELPADRPRPAVQTFRGGRERVVLPVALAERLQALGRREGATLFMTLLAAFQALLSRQAGQADVVVGTPIAGRTRAETEGLIGLFVNTLALRADLSADPTFRALLAQVRETTLGAYANQDLPFERLVEALQPERSLGYTPVFQVLFTVDEPAAGLADLPGLRTELLPEGEGTSKFDLSLSAMATADGLRCTLTYNADLFDAATARRLLDQLGLLLEAASADAELRVSALPLLADEERAPIATWQQGPALPAVVDSFPAQFAATAAALPDAVAIEHAGERVTYAELDARSNRLAHHLRRLGMGPEARVGVCLERTPELVVTLLGVLKSGAAYVPLEPHFPAERIASVLGDAEASLLVAHGSAASIDLPCPALLLDHPEVRETIAGEADSAPSIGIDPDTLAHVIYTSGSTGRPKGVMIRHGGVGAYVAWMRQRFPLAPGEKVLGSTSVCFDVHVAEVHFALASGGTLVLVRDALALAELPADAWIVHAGMVPTAAQELLALGAIPPSLRRMNLAGEAVPGDLVRGLYAAGVAEVGNGYGPTEDTTYSTFADLAADRRVTVGRPLGGRRTYVLDGALRPVPAGVVGEVYVAGCGVSRGYLARPEMTAERYLPDPFGAPGERMYATGDRARWLAGGEIEYLGRADHQVKVRGFRIEPGEVEGVLRAHPSVLNAAVGVRGDGAARRLVAWIVPAEGASPASAELAAFLRERLPEYMVPGAFAVLDAFPLTTSGKIDRLALPEPDWTEAAEAYVAPRTPVEEVLAAIWADVLGIDRVGARDDFFALGGHSLLATRVVSRVRQALGVELPLRALFEHATIAALAARIEGSARAEASPIPVVDRAGPLPLSFAQQRLWFLEQLEPGGSAYHVPVALRLRGALDVPVLERALAEIVRRHEPLRTTFAEVDGEPVQVIGAPAPVAVAVSGVAEAELRDALREEAGRPFDLARGPLFRARLFRIAADEQVLLIAMHHAATDGWSIGVLLREVEAIYAAFAEGRPSPLPELAVQYADVAAWQRAHLASGEMDRQLAWWKERLAGAPAVLELPTDRPRAIGQDDAGASEELALPRPLADAVSALARREGATLFMTLLAAYQVLLSRGSGQEDVVVGSPIAGRTRPEMEGL